MGLRVFPGMHLIASRRFHTAWVGSCRERDRCGLGRSRRS